MRSSHVTGFLLTLLLGAALPTALSAQGEKPKPQTAKPGTGAQKGAGDEPKGGSAGDEEKIVDPNRPKSGLNRFGRLSASMSPRRIAPGQTGTATFYFSVGTRYAVLSDERVDLLPTSVNPDIRLGQVTIKPAEIGPIGTPFAGRNYYGNIVKATAPVSIGPDLQYGTHGVGMLFRLPICDRASGRGLGVYQGAALLSISVGDPLPTMPDLGRGGDDPRPRDDEETTDRNPTTTGPQRVEPADGERGPGVGDGMRAVSGSRDDEAEAGDLPLTPPVEDGGDPLLLIVAGVSILGILGLLLGRKSK